jgi:LacI family transcriptional regulator
MEDNLAKVKISDIAEKAGVSAGTVDRVIHNRGEVAEKTRQKVLAIVREMNYEPDILASTLASKKSYRFVSLTPRADAANPFWASPTEGLKQAWQEIRHFGVSLDQYFFPYHDRAAFTSELDKIINNPPSGLILAPIFTEQTIQAMEKLTQMKIPVVFLNTLVEKQQNISFVGQAPVYSGMVVARLLEYGLHQDAQISIINLVSEKGGNTHILNREKGFREYFSSSAKSSAIQLNTINITSQDPLEFDSLLEKHIGIDDVKPKSHGIFVTNSKVFLVAEFLEKKGMKNFNLVGYDLLEQNQGFLRKGIIDFLISQQPHQQGYNSVITLFNALIMKKEIAKNQYLPIDIITKENIDFYLNN